jgi:alkylation response protein AidB-like acyl-CoA dehydrogenase
MAYAGVDYMKIDSLFSDEELMVRDSVRQWVEAAVMPTIASHYEAGTVDPTWMTQMGEMGILGANLSGYGLPGMSNVAYGLVMQELERGDSGLRSSGSVQGALVMYPIHAYGSEEQKTKWLPALHTAKAIGCFGLTEADHGSDPGGMKTRAVKDGSDWVINGNKMWITNGTRADVAVVWAATDEGIQGFLIERDAKGFTSVEQKMKASLRSSITAELFFDDVRVPDSNRLPKVKGLKGPLGCLTQARSGIAFGAVGAAMACYEEARNYALSRIQFGGPIARFQLIQAKLADMVTEITKAQLLALQLGRLKDKSEMHHSHVSMAKRNNVAMALDVARSARDVLGANGISLEYQSIRHMCNLESVYTYEGTHSIHTLVIGETVTGIPAYSEQHVTAAMQKMGHRG